MNILNPRERVRYVTLKKYAELRGKSPKSVSRALAEGQIKDAIKHGRWWFISKYEPWPKSRRWARQEGERKMSETSNKECQEPLTPCLQSRCKPDETGSTNQDQVHEGAQGSMEQRRRRDAAELNAAKQPPTPVAWADLKVGETYWGIRSRGPLFIFDKFKCDFDEDDNQHSLECSGDILWYEDEFRKDSEGRLMIYATPADAVAAMKAALDQWLEGVGK